MSDDSKSDFLEEREFYERMQVYRHSPLMPPHLVLEAFERVKDHIRAEIAKMTKQNG